MKASELIEQLQNEMREHGDLEVSVITGNHEFLAMNASFAAEGSIAKWSPHQNPPARIVIEAEDKLDDAE